MTVIDYARVFEVKAMAVDTGPGSLTGWPWQLWVWAVFIMLAVMVVGAVADAWQPGEAVAAGRGLPLWAAFAAG